LKAFNKGLFISKYGTSSILILIVSSLSGTFGLFILSGGGGIEGGSLLKGIANYTNFSFPFMYFIFGSNNTNYIINQLS
jgi:hypothetical protein